MVPRCVQEGPGWLLYESSGGQDRSKEAQDGPKMRPGGPRCIQEGKRRAQLQELDLDPLGLQILVKNLKDLYNFIKAVLGDKV